ncbi:exported hypothetical protein [Gammaproteobacteria bacterium]
MHKVMVSFVALFIMSAAVADGISSSDSVIKSKHPVISKTEKLKPKNSYKTVNGNPYFGVMAGVGFARMGEQHVNFHVKLTPLEHKVAPKIDPSNY